MPKSEDSIFRDEALEQLSSPEQVDQLLQVVTARSWIPIATLGALLLVTLVWSVAGHIPVTVEGVALLVRPRQIVSMQMPASGQIVELHVKVGDVVQKGQLLGLISQPTLQQSLDQERIRLAETHARQSKIRPLRDRRSELERQANEQARRVLQQRIDSTVRTAGEQKARNASYFKTKLDSLEQLRNTKRTLNENYKARYEGYQQLKNEGLVSNDAVLAVRQNYIDNEAQIGDIELQMNDTRLQELRANETYEQQMELVADFRTQLAELDVKARQIEQQDIETASESDLQIQDIERTIARYEEDLKTKSRIITEYTGRILEVTSSVGQIVGAGERLGAMEIEDAKGKLVAVSYFTVSDGKKIEPGMDVRVTPATVERERYGSIVGKVQTVSPFPVTTEAVTNVVGNAEVAQNLSGGGNKIEVFADLELDSSSPTGFRWTSGKGPELSITPGTTSSVRVTVEYTRPIALVIPFLRRWTGV